MNPKPQVKQKDTAKSNTLSPCYSMMIRRLDLRFAEECLEPPPTTCVSYANKATYDMKIGVEYKLSLSHYSNDLIHCSESKKPPK